MIKTGYLLSGVLLGVIALSIFLYTISAGTAYPVAASSSIVNQDSINQTSQSARSEKTSSPASKSEASAASIPGDCHVSNKYPESILQWCHIITTYADKRGLDPDLVAALIWQESGGKPGAYSSSGAVGLMQIMPSDGVAASFMCINGPCFSNRPSIKELEDPEFNISYGTKMLASLEARSGDLREALKSYGPMNVGYYYADKVIGIYQRYRVK